MSTVTATIVEAATAAVALSAALRDVWAFIRRFVVLTKDQATAVTLWVAHTHAIVAADCTPYLQVTSATKRAGKTRLLEVVEPLVARPWLTGRTSAAALVRKIDAAKPTLLLDESDAAFNGEREYAEALRAVLNSGYRKSGKATVCVGQGVHMTTRDFATFGPKAICGIGTLPGTVADRAIPIALKRRRSDEPCERWREREGHADATPLKTALVAAVTPFIDRLRDARPALPTTLGDRQADVWEPLLAIADAAGNSWPDAARAAAKELVGQMTDEDVTIELLTDIRDILAAPAMRGADPKTLLPTKVLLAALVALDDRPWATWRRGDQPLTGRGLARLLGPLDIAPSGDHDNRGYRRDAFNDAFARYLPIHVSMCREPNKSGPESAFSMCREDAAPDTCKSEESPIKTASATHRHIDPGDTRERGEDTTNGVRL